MIGLTRTGELVRLEIPPQPAFVGVARSMVTTVASTLDGIDDDRLEDLRVAVSEACTNALEAHRLASIDDHVVVCCSIGEDHFEVSVEDRAKGVDVAREREGSAWGIQLIHALVDDVAFRETEWGTAVDLVIRFDVGGAQDERA